MDKPASIWKSRIIKLTLVYGVITAVICIAVLYYFNATIVTDTSPDSASSGIQSAFTAADAKLTRLANASNSSILPGSTAIPENAGFLSFSADGRFMDYLLNGRLYIRDMTSGKVLNELASYGDITYSLLMHDRNIIIYFSLHKASAGSSGKDQITVSTYNIDTKENTVQEALPAPSGSIIKYADYSSMTGHMYFDVRNGNNDAVYYVNMMKALKKVSIPWPISSMLITNIGGAMYYEHNGVLYCENKIVDKLANIKTSIIGIDKNDDIYVQSLNDDKKIYMVSGSHIVKTLEIQDPGYTSAFSDKSSVYLIFPDHLLNITDGADKVTRFESRSSFVYAAGGTLYLKDGKGNIHTEVIN